MSQNHHASDGIPGRGHIDESLLNTMGQYHGGYPWFYILWALLPIRDLERCFPRAYATSPRQIHVCLETYSFHHRSSTYWIPFFITFCTHCRYIRFKLFNRFINSRITSSGGLPSRTTHCIILPTISPFGLDGNHDGFWSPQQIGILRIQWHHVTLTLPIISHHSFPLFKHHITLPLWHQGQRADQNQHKGFLLM